MSLFASDLTRDLDFPEHDAVITIRALTWAEDEIARNKGEAAAYKRIPEPVIAQVFDREGPKDDEARESARAAARDNPAYDTDSVLSAGVIKITVAAEAAKRDAYKRLKGDIAKRTFDAILALTNPKDESPEPSEA